MKLTLSSGHSDKIRGAKGLLDERDEAVRVVDQVASFIKEIGDTVHVYHDHTSTTQAKNVNGIVAYHNGTERELDVSIHFNANKTTELPVGSEVLYLSDEGKVVATKLAAAVSKAGGFKNRGAKKREDLGFLKTKKPAVLLEVCFVDSKKDSELYKERFTEICQAIAETLTGKKVPVKKATDTKTKNYTLKLGDTLSQLAIQNNTEISKLLKLNPSITNPNKIYVGQKIKLPK